MSRRKKPEPSGNDNQGNAVPAAVLYDDINCPGEYDPYALPNSSLGKRLATKLFPLRPDPDSDSDSDYGCEMNNIAMSPLRMKKKFPIVSQSIIRNRRMNAN